MLKETSLKCAENEAILPRKTKLSLNNIISEAKKYARLLQFDEAISSFNTVLDQDPDNSKALKGRAECYLRLAKYLEARQDMKRALKLNPHLKDKYEICLREIQNYLVAKNTILDTRGIYSSDMKYLEDFSTDENSPHVLALTKNLLNYLSERQRYLRIQDQISKHFIQSNSKYINKSKLCNSRISTSIYNQLHVLESVIKSRDSRTCIQEGYSLLEILSKMNLDIFPEKFKVQTSILHFLIMAHLMEGDISSALEQSEKQLSISRVSGVPEFIIIALRDIGEICCISKQYAKACQFFEENFELITSEEEKHILLYKISNCMAFLNNCKMALSIAKRCLNFARQSKDYRFLIDTMLLSAEISVKINKMYNAERYIRDALEISGQVGDPREKRIDDLLDIFVKNLNNTEKCSDSLKYREDGKECGDTIRIGKDKIPSFRYINN